MAINPQTEYPSELYFDETGNFGKPSTTTKPPEAEGGSKLSQFIATIKQDRGRLNKPYLYEVLIYNQLDSGIVRKMSLYCHAASIPGYSLETKRGRVYGLDYEIPINIEQDPIWLRFYADSKFQIPNLFLDTLRQDNNYNGSVAVFDASYSPRYKDDISLQVIINILDEEFNTVSSYVLQNCMFKVVQTMELDASTINKIQSVSAQLVFERMAVFTSFPVPKTSGKQDINAFINVNAEQPGNISSVTAGDMTLANPESTNVKGATISDGGNPFTSASASIAAARNTFNSLGITDVIHQVSAARKMILDPLHQINENRALTTSTIAQINSVKNATLIEMNQGKAIMASFGKLF